MDRLLMMHDLQFIPKDSAYVEGPRIELDLEDVIVKFRVKCADGRRGIAINLDDLHGTPEENAQNIANLCNLPCQWVASDQRAVWSTCEPGD